MRKKEEEQGVKTLKFITCVLVSGIIALFLCILFLFICSLLISNGLLGGGSLTQYTVAVCAISSFCGGIYASIRYRSKTLLVGVCTGLVLFLLLLTIGILCFPGVTMENHGVGLLCATLFGGALAGLMGAKPKKKRRK